MTTSADAQLISPVGPVDPPPHLESADEEESPSDYRDERAEGHLRAIGLWLYLLGISSIALPVADWRPDSLTALVVFFAPVAVGCFTLGFFLRRFSGAARTITRGIVLIVLVIRLFQLFANVIAALAAVSGLALGVALMGGAVFVGWPFLVLRTLSSERSVEVCEPWYRLYNRGLSIPWGFLSPHFWAPLLVIGAWFGLSVLAH